MRILALVPGGIGDQLLFFPTLETLKQEYPKGILDVMVEPRAKGAYRVCPYVHEVLTFDFKDRNGLADYANLLGMIRDREYDISVSLGQRWTIGFLLWLNGVPVRVGYQTTPAWFITNPVPLKTEQYAAHMYHDLVRGLGLQTPCPPLKVSVPRIDIDWLEAERKYLGIQDSGYIALHGGSSQLAQSKGINKIYPAPKWQRVIEDIQRQQPNVAIVLIKGPEDREWVEQMQSLIPSVKVIQPADIGKLAATIAGAKLMLCTDSAPMHLSVAVGTYTIALFGPTDMKKLLPPDEDKYIGIQAMTKEIDDIQPNEILEKVWRV